MGKRTTKVKSNILCHILNRKYFARQVTGLILILKQHQLKCGWNNNHRKIFEFSEGEKPQAEMNSRKFS